MTHIEAAAVRANKKFNAFADGKQMQWNYSNGGWRDELTLSVQNFLHQDSLIRIKPKPKLRPWDGPEEIPVGALIRNKNWKAGEMATITGNFEGKVWWSGVKRGIIPADVAIYMIYSTDHGKTWLPCGVQTEES